MTKYTVVQNIVDALARIHLLDWYNNGEWVLHYIPISFLVIFISLLNIFFFAYIFSFLKYKDDFKACIVNAIVVHINVSWVYLFLYSISITSLAFYLMVNYV